MKQNIPGFQVKKKKKKKKHTEKSAPTSILRCMITLEAGMAPGVSNGSRGDHLQPCMCLHLRCEVPYIRCLGRREGNHIGLNITTLWNHSGNIREESATQIL